MASGKTPAQIRQLVKGSGGSFEKIRHKPKKFTPEKDRRNTDKNKFKESFSSENV